MTTRANTPSIRRRNPMLGAVAIAFFATLLGGQSHAALVVPANPLVSGTLVAPNILFILDDSGSMEEDTMLNQDVSTIQTAAGANGNRLDLSSVGSPINSRSRDERNFAYTYNTLYYNPHTTYKPWMKGDKSYLEEVTPTLTFTDPNLTVAVPARGTVTATTASSKDSIQSSARKFWVAEDNLTNLGDLSKYTYYELTNASSAKKCVPAKDAKQNWYWNCSVVTSFTWSTAGGGTVTRTIAEEWQNYATWYGYHRTRIKAAKAGASYAFAALGDNYRVGYRSIWGRRTMNIPVTSGGGLFKDSTTGTDQYLNRTIWFERLYSAEGDQGTPLQGALQDAGEYFQTDEPYKTGGDDSGMLACRQNFSILTTDGYWNNNNSFQSIGNIDNASGTTMTGPRNDPYTYTAARPYSDGFSDTLGDIAMHFWKTDLRTDLDNIVPADPVKNPAFWQHMVTFGISIGLKGLLSESDIPALTSGAKSWGDPSGSTDKPEKIDDLLHAAVNSYGKFVAATDPEAFTKGLRAALDTIDERPASGSNVSFNSGTLTAGSKSYIASFVSGRWTGDVKAYAVSDDGVSPTADWNAAAHISAAGSRTILTFNGNGVVPTTFPTNAQQTVLTQAIANYVRGDRTGEGVTYRARGSVFGDVVNSSPVYVKEGTTETVYVGANDGMLHAIDATNGNERFTYVPGLVNMSELKKLSLKDEFVHKFFVDGPIVVTTRQQTTNKNMLIGTLGRGGKGVYGLNVTSPTTFATDGRAWEFAGDTDMGMVLGRPLIVKLNNTGNTTAVLVPNGINSTNDKAVLFVLNAETGAQIAKITTNAEVANGLSMPTALDLDNNGTADVVYAGDLQGNVWKFDISSSTESTWAATKFFTATHTTSTTVNGTTTTTTRRQPITGGITVAYNPATFHPWVLFGTGRYITETDPDDRSIQSWYGMEDDGTAVAGRDDLKEREIKLAAVVNGRKVRAFEESVAGDMVDDRGWVVDLVTPPDDTAEGERMIGDQFVVAGSVLVAASVIPSDDGCGTGGNGFLNFIDAFSGAATSGAFIDLNGDGSFDARDELPRDSNGDGQNDDSTPGGSIDLGVGMGSDPGALLPGYPSGGNPLFCQNGSTGTPGCVPFNWGPGFGRISWREVLKD